MDLYTKTKPELIADDILVNIRKDLGEMSGGTKHGTLSDYLYYLYDEYLSPNMFIIFIIIGIGIFIILNMMLRSKLQEVKKEKRQKKAKKESTDSTISSISLQSVG